MKTNFLKKSTAAALAIMMLLSVSAITAQCMSTRKSGTELTVGDRIIISKYSGTEVKADGVEYNIVRQSDILAIVE